MAKYQPLPKTLKECDTLTLNSFIRLVESTWPKDLSLDGPNKALNEPATTFDGKYHWTTNKDLLVYITQLTGTGNIGDADKTLYQTLTRVPEYTEPTMTGAPEAPTSATTPGQATREQQEQMRVEQGKALKETSLKAKENVQAGINRQQQIYAEQKAVAEKLKAQLEKNGSKVYVKVEGEEKLTTQQEQMKAQAQANPRQFVNDTADKIDEKVQNPLVAKETAYSTYEYLSGNSPKTQAAVMQVVASSNDIKNNLFPEAINQEQFKDITDVLTNQSLSLAELSENLFKFEQGNLKISVSLSPKNGFQEYDINQRIISPYLASINQSTNFLEQIGGLGREQIKSNLLLHAGRLMDVKIAQLPTGSLTSQLYNSSFVQTYFLPTMGFTQSSIVADEGSILGKVLVSSGNGPLAGFVQDVTGISLGVDISTAAATTATATSIAATGGVMASEAFLGGAGAAAAGAAAGSFVPIVGNIISAIVGFVASKILEKIPWDKIKKWSAAILGFGAGLIALPFLGLGGALGIGVGTTAISAAFGAGLGGLTLAGIGGGIASFFGALGAAFLGAVGIPILITLIGFPVVVALILFIINSGAYVVPPGGSTFAGPGSLGGINCTTEQTPTGINYSVNSPIATRALEIVNGLYQGFWCYWNHSPEFDPAYWDEARFRQNPNPPEKAIQNCPSCLFWCTTLVVESYPKGSIQNTLWAPTMKIDFENRGKYKSAQEVSPKDIPSGSVIFFQKQGESIIDHVGIVYRTDINGLVFIQSNAGDKTGQLAYNAQAKNWSYTELTYIKVVGFGLP